MERLDKDILRLRSSLEELSNSLVDTIVEKNKLYGDSLTENGFDAVVLLLSIKASRLRNLNKRKSEKEASKAIEDTLRDMACYAMLGLLILRGENGN